jgi:hypothetical protein
MIDSVPSPELGGRRRAPADGVGAVVLRRLSSLGDTWLVAILAAGLLVRLAFFVAYHDIRIQSDELQYQEIAVNLAEGRGFMLEEQPTSWRPPLYPFLMAILYRVTGSTEPAIVRAFQSLVSLATVVAVHRLAWLVFGMWAARAAALLVAFYPPLLFYNTHLLTEPLFLFLSALVAVTFVEYLMRPRLPLLLASGAALGLAALTRDVIWPTVAIMAGLIWWSARLPRPRVIAHALALVLVLAAVVAPWVVRNTRVQGTFTLISTNGGMVFLANHYEHTPLDRPWRAHSLAPEQKVRYLLPLELSEGIRQKLAVQRALRFIRQHPGLTVRNTLIRAANVWGFERNVIGAAIAGAYGRLSRPALVILSGAIVAVEAVTLLAGLAGLCFALAQGGRPMGAHLYVAAMVVFTTVIHALVSGHARYHLPLIPLLGMYAAYLWTIRREVLTRRPRWALAAATACGVLLVAGWIREVAFVELERFLRTLNLS